jgi:site-specific recombinase XerD
MDNDLTSSFRTYLLQNGRSQRTANAYVADVARYVTWCERTYAMAFVPSMVNRSDLHDYQSQCRKVDGLQAATWNRYIASLTTFAAWLGVDVSGAMTRAEGQKLAPQSLDESAYRRLRLTVREAVRTAKTAAKARLAARNAAIFTLLADAGLREGEVVNLRLDCLLLGGRKGRVVVKNAKGNKDRAVPLDKDSLDMLKAWIALRPACRSDALFVGVRGDSLQGRGIQKLVAQLARDAGIGHVTPHQLRHTAAYRWMANGAQLNQVAELLGHSSIEVTRRYTLPHYADLEAIVEAA